jgi:hypothetical protein
MYPEVIIVPFVFGIPAVVIALRMLLKHREKMASLGAAPLSSSDSDARLMRVESVVEAMAVELERIGEGQRFLTRLLAERSQSSEAADRVGART